MSHNPENTLKPLRGVEGDVIALRTGQGGAAGVVRISRAAEMVLRRMLRDDPTAPVELRLRALSPDDLSTGELLAELRRRDRLPMELAATFHELAASANRLASEGGDATPRDRDVAIAAADGLENHILSHPYDAALVDPVVLPAAEQTLIPPAPEDPGAVHSVPPSGGSPVWPWMVAGVALIALVVILAVALRGRGPDSLRQGEEAYSRGDTTAALPLFVDAAAKHPNDPAAHYYLAQIYRNRNRPQDAARELSAGLRAAPNDPRLNTEEGYLMLQQGRAPQAVKQFRTAILLDSTSARAWAGMVTALRRAGMPGQAQNVLARAPNEVRELLAGMRDTVPAAAAPGTAIPAPGTATAGTGVVPQGGSTYPPDTTGTVPAPVRP